MIIDACTQNINFKILKQNAMTWEEHNNASCYVYTYLLHVYITSIAPPPKLKTGADGVAPNWKGFAEFSDCLVQL